MAPKLTAQQLLAQLKQAQEDTAAFKDLWQELLPPDLPLPPDFEIKNAVLKLHLADLLQGIQTYVIKIGAEKSTPTSQNAMKYICAAAWNIKEQENPDKTFHPTPRRQRNAKQV